MKNRKTVIGVVAVCVVAAIFAAVMRMRGSDFDWAGFRAALAGSNPVLMAMSAGFILLTYFGRAFRWRVMMRPVCANPPIMQIVSATVVGFTAIVFFGRPGEFVRPWLIAKQQRVSVSSQLAAWVLERVFDLLMVLLLFGFALTQVDPKGAFGPSMRTVLASGGVLALGLGIACVAVIVITAVSADLSRRLFQWAVSFLPQGIGRKLAGIFDSFLTGMSSTGSFRSLTALFAWSIVEWMVILAALHCALKAYPDTAHFRPVDSTVFAGFVTFGSAVQLPGIGGGMQVATVLVATELFGLRLESATALALVVWVLTWLSVVPIGVITAFAQGLKWGALRHVEEEAKV
jgi:uncharacterized membrane protein YbhN (UPF0104 family)